MTRRAEQSFQIEVARYLQLVLLPEVAWTAFPAGGLVDLLLSFPTILMALRSFLKATPSLLAFLSAW